MRFIPNPAIASALAAEEAYDQGRQEIGEAIAKNVEEVAPETTGAYKDSIKVSDEGSVYTEDPMGHLVEWGSVNNDPYGPIRKGVKMSGLRLDETPKGKL